MRSKFSVRKFSVGAVALVLAASMLLTGCGGDGGTGGGDTNSGTGSTGSTETVKPNKPEDNDGSGSGTSSKVNLTVKEATGKQESNEIPNTNQILLVKTFTVYNASDKEIKLGDLGFRSYEALNAKYSNNILGMFDDVSYTGSSFKVRLKNGEWKKCVAVYAGTNDTLKAKDSVEIMVAVAVPQGFESAVFTYDGNQVGVMKEETPPTKAIGKIGDTLTAKNIEAKVSSLEYDAETKVCTVKMTVKNGGDAAVTVDLNKVWLGYYKKESNIDYSIQAKKMRFTPSSTVAPGATVTIEAEYDITSALARYPDLETATKLVVYFLDGSATGDVMAWTDGTLS